MDGGESQFGCCINTIRFFLPAKTKILQGSVTSVLVPDTDGAEMHPQLNGVGGAVMKKSLNWEGEVAALIPSQCIFKRRKR